MRLSQEEQFIRDQIQEIFSYLRQHTEENPNGATLHWIEQNAKEFRRRWEEKHSS